MYAKLIAVTQPVDQEMTAEQLIAFCARVSSPENQFAHETAPKLLEYCLKNGHWSVFEMADMTVEVETSIAVSRQILRHKSLNFQEFSQRYAKVRHRYEKAIARAPHPKNRQLSLDTLSDATKIQWKNMLEQVESLASVMYDQALRMGIAKEVARFILPLSTSTTMYIKANVRSWLTYFMQRLHVSTQLEHRELAQEMFIIFEAQFPQCAQVLKTTHPDLEYPAELTSVAF